MMAGIAVLDARGRLAWVSHEIPAARGRTRGRPVLDMICEESINDAKYALVSALIERKPCSLRVRAGFAGDIRTWQCRITPVTASAVIAYQQIEALSPLTLQEQQILTLTCNDIPAKQIASELGITEHAVENAHRRIRRKIGVKGIAGEIKWAVEHGLAQ